MAVSADVDIANMALQRLGQPVISSLTDSGRDAEICNQLFAQNRNYCLMLSDWQCVTQRRVLARTGNYAISDTSQANPVVVTCATHTIAANELVTIEDVVGMTELNDVTFRAYSVTSVTITLYDTDGTTVNGSSYTAYSDSGTLYLAPGGDWARVYDVPSDCAKPINVLDSEFAVSTEHWIQEKGRIYTDVENAGLEYLALDTTASNYDELLVEVMAARLAWMISMRIHSDKQLRAEMRAEMDRAVARARIVDASGRYRGDTAEDLWINAG